MPDLQLDIAVANRFISSLSKSLQALCHGCMDFDSGIEIVGYINVNIDSGSKVDYVLNEKVLKSTTNSMTFVSNSFLAKKDNPKQTRDGACSPIPELRPVHSASYRGAYQGPRSSMQFAHSFAYRGSQKRPWTGLERDWRMSPKKHRGGRMGHSSSYTGPHNPSLASPSISESQPDPNFKIPIASEENTSSDAAINVKTEIADEGGEHLGQSETDQSSIEQSNEDSSQPPDLNIKKDPDTANSDPSQQTNEESQADASSADFKDTFLHPANGSNNTDNSAEADSEFSHPSEQQTDSTSKDTSLLPEQSDSGDISGELGATSDSFAENLPSGSGEYGEGGDEESYSQTVYPDPGEGSSDAGQFEVIEIEDEDEDVQGLFGDSRENGMGTKRRYRRALKAAMKMHSHRTDAEHVPSDKIRSEAQGCEGSPSAGLYGQRNSVEICSFCRTALPMGTTYQQHFTEVHASESTDSSLGDIACPFTCEICQKTFVTKERLRQHSVVHDATLYSCFVCDVKFKHKKNIKRHMETTHGLQKCSFCLAFFSKGEEFDSHVLICVDSVKGDVPDEIESLYTY